MIAVGLVLVALGVGGTWLAGALAGSETLRGSLVQGAREGLGLGLELGEVEILLVPARVRLRDAAFVLPADVKLRVEETTLSVALWPLVTAARAEVRRLGVEGKVGLEGATDTVPAAASGSLAPLPDGGFRATLAGAFDAGGRFAFSGETGTASPVLELSVEGVDPVPLVALVPSLGERTRGLSGRFDGTLALREPQPEQRVLEVELTSQRARIGVEDVVVDGPVEVRAKLDWSHLLPVGPFDIDASRAAVSYAGGLQTASAAGATLRGRLVARGGTLHVDDFRLALSSFRGELRLEGDVE